MKIIEQGYIPPTYRFTCINCHTVFEAESKECVLIPYDTYLSVACDCPICQCEANQSVSLSRNKFYN